MAICIFYRKFPQGNRICSGCDLLYETCIPTCSANGIALSSECSIEYFCPGCPMDCPNKDLINL